MRYISIIFFGLLFVGCSATKVAVTEYKISANLNLKKSMSKSFQTKSLKISKCFSSNKLKTLNMNYMQGKSKVYSYSQSIWSESPNEAITSEVLKMLRDKQIFKSVQSSKSRVKSDLVLEITMDKFIQSFDNELKNSYADIALNFSLIDAKTNKVITSKNFKAKYISNTPDANGGVEALNKALNKVLIDSENWFEEIAK